MKTKGFTLIELLAVIVILAIIALIATPIILGIITDARKEANLRSAELYIVAVKQSIARKSLTTEITNTTCTVQSNGNISCEGVSGELEVQMSGNKATEGTIVIERGDVVDVQNLKVNNITYKYDNTRTLVEGTSSGQSSLFLCERQNGTSKTTGAEYECHLDIDRTFYVLGENANDSTKIDLIMDRNYVDTNVTKSTPWCDPSGDPGYYNTCIPNITRYVPYIQTAFGNDVVVSLPTYDQIYAVNESDTLTSTPWLYGNLHSYEEDGALNQAQLQCANAYEASSQEVPMNIACEDYIVPIGYWTSSPYPSDLDYAWCVTTYDGGVLEPSAPDNLMPPAGVRPVITVSESLMD